MSWIREWNDEEEKWQHNLLVCSNWSNIWPNKLKINIYSKESGMEKKVRIFYALSRISTLLTLHHVHQPGNSLSLVIFGIFMKASLHMHDWLNLWPLAIDSTWKWGGGMGKSWKFPPSNYKVGSPGNQPPALGAFQMLLFKV